MKVQIERGGKIIDVDRLKIIIGDTEYNIHETQNAYIEKGNITINKICFDGDESITITPSVSNLIHIK